MGGHHRRKRVEIEVSKKYIIFSFLVKELLNVRTHKTDYALTLNI